MDKTIVIINQKGGVAKTTTAFTLANYYAEKGLKTLAVDLDPQGNLTYAFNIKTDTINTITDYFLDSTISVDLIKVNEMLSVIPCDISFSSIEMQIINSLNREYILSKTLKRVKGNFDICIIDCPPAMNIITINALTASNYAIIPLKPSSFSYKGLDSMIQFITSIREEVNPNIVLLGIVLTFFDPNRIVSKTTLEKLEADNFISGVFDTKIRMAEVMVRAEEVQKSIFDFSKNSSVAKDYMLFAEEVLAKINKLENNNYEYR